MTFFKIVQNNQVTDAGFVFLQWNEVHHEFNICDVDHGQFVQNYKQTKIYSASWLKPAPQEAGSYERAEVVVITEQEYFDLIAQLDEGEEIIEPEEPMPDVHPAPEPEEEIPMTLAEMRETIKSQAEQITFLENCLMEMSEFVYS